MHAPRTALATCAAVLLFASGSSAQTLKIDPLPEDVARPAIDGRLDDAAWEFATLIGPLHQVTPVAGAAPSERTEARLTFDSKYVYLSLKCFDREPELIRATLSQRDANLNPDDRVEWLFDTFYDRRNAFWFQIGAGGSIGDSLISRNGTRFDKRWDTLWDGQARVTDEGWQAEVRIPAQSINFDPEQPRWGFNLRRHIRRRNEEARWTAYENRLRFFQVSQSGTIEGIRGLRQGLGLDLRPFVVGDWTSFDDTTDTEFDGGLDVFYRISPATKLSMTFNTDFAEVEVDDRQVNLTRFPLFFPERRDFFLEDSGSFLFGPGGGRGSPSVAEPFFSRRIGLDANGQEVPIDVALKLTSRTETSNLGVLGARTGSSTDTEGQELFVGRYSRNIGAESDVGVVWTHGDPRGEGRDDTFGVDLNLRSTRFRGDSNLRFSAFALRSDANGEEGQDAWYVGLGYPNDEVQWNITAAGVDENFDPSLGFVRRTGIRTYAGNFSYRPRLYSSIRRLGFSITPEVVLDTGNDLASSEVSVQPLSIEWESGEELRFEVEHAREVLLEPFEISDGIEIDSGGYTFTRYSVRAESAEKRSISGFARYELGDFFDGERADLSLGVNWRPSAIGSFEAEYVRNDVDLPAGDFRVHIARVRAQLQFGPELSWSNFVQWDNRSENLGLNSRLWWIPKPGTEYFLVVNQGWNWDTSSFTPETTQVTFKVGTTIRF